MSEFSSWMQSNWHALGTLLVQLAFLVGGVWFARDILKTMRAFQEQAGALLKMSITGATTERDPSSTSARLPLADTDGHWLTSPERQAVRLPELTESGPGRFAVARRQLIRWLQAPMSCAEVAPWRRVIRWLQTPVGS